MSTCLDRAHAAKDDLAARIGDHPAVVDVRLMLTGTEYRVHVIMAGETTTPLHVPDTLDGVEIVVTRSQGVAAA